MFKGYSVKVALALMVALAALGVGLAAAAPAFAQGGTNGASVPETPPAGGQHISYAAFTGAPTIVDGQNRFWAWNENVSGQNILHIRTTTDGSAHTFTGTINTAGAGNFYNLALVNADGDDSTSMIAYNQFTFSIKSSAGEEGVDVDWSGRWLSLDLNFDGYPRPAKVLYGPGATAANNLPLIVVAGNNGLLTLSLSTLDGATMFQKNIADGYFLYRTTDTNGKYVYHMRLTTTHPGDLKDYKGNIKADDGKFGVAHIYKGDPRDFVTLLGDREIKFRFVTDGYEDGLDWTLSANAGLTFTLRMNGEGAAPKVWLGSADPAQPGIPAFTFRLVP